jgi:hypothetical protein
MPTNFIAVIDGTGDFSDKVYHSTMRNSFCTQIASSAVIADYQRGPSGEGFGTRFKAHNAAKWLKQAKTRVSDARLFLAGYSRGASAAIYAAELLEEDSIQVYGLFLFDAVKRHVFRYGEVIPANVLYSRHARRKMSSDLVRKYEGTITILGTPTGDKSGLGNPMRTSFGNTGLRSKVQGNHEAEEFLGSHGALGGCGFRHVFEDYKCQKDVAAYMRKAMMERGLAVNIEGLGLPIPHQGK